MYSRPVRYAAVGLGLAFLGGCTSTSPETEKVYFDVASSSPSPTTTVQESIPTQNFLAPFNEAPSQEPPAPVEPEEKREAHKNKVAVFGTFIIDSCGGVDSPYTKKTKNGLVSFEVGAGKLLYGKDYDESAPQHSVCTQKEVTVLEAAYGGLEATFSRKPQNTNAIYSLSKEEQKEPRSLKLSLEDGTLKISAPNGSVKSLSCENNLGQKEPNLEVDTLCEDGIVAQEVIEGLLAGKGNPLHDGIAKSSIKLLKKYIPKKTSNAPFAVLDLSGIATKSN